MTTAQECDPVTYFKLALTKMVSLWPCFRASLMLHLVSVSMVSSDGVFGAIESVGDAA